jgi:hypothetical protein
MDLGTASPHFWRDPEEPLPNSALASSTHCLTHDFCIVEGQHYFVRCILQLPLIGAPGEHFAFGVWSSLAEKNFRIYVDTFDSGEQAGVGPWFGWFSNRLEGYPDTLGLKCRVHPQADHQRPWIEVEDSGHPLATESREGITYDRLLQIYAAYGHAPSVDRLK